MAEEIIQRVKNLDTPEGQPSTLVCISSGEESAVALRFGCLRAKRRGHHLTLLHVVEPTEFQGLSSITEAIRQEREEEADRLVTEMEERAGAQGIKHPAILVREDSLSGGILAAIEENPDISMIVLAIGEDSHRGPKLVAALTEQLCQKIKIPIMIAPGNLTPDQVDELS